MVLNIHYLVMDCGPASNLEGRFKVEEEKYMFELRDAVYNLHGIFFVLNKIDRSDLVVYVPSNLVVEPEITAGADDPVFSLVPLSMQTDIRQVFKFEQETKYIVIAKRSFAMCAPTARPLSCSLSHPCTPICRSKPHNIYDTTDFRQFVTTLCDASSNDADFKQALEGLAETSLPVSFLENIRHVVLAARDSKELNFSLPPCHDSRRQLARPDGLARKTKRALRAKALYTYTADPDDPAELSFEQGEVFDILAKDDNWWGVRKMDGTRGIAPSNYLQLLK